MRAACGVAIGLWVVCLVLRLSLPAWDVCRHRDGRVCDEVVPRSCCGAGAPAGVPADAECADCTDLHVEPGSSPQRTPELGLGASGDPGLPSALIVDSALLTGSLVVALPFSGVAPPYSPRLNDSLPLRC